MKFHPEPPRDTAFHISDFTGFRKEPMPIEEYGPIDLPDDAYFEYGWLRADREYLQDPTGTRADNPWYHTLYCTTGPGYQPGPLNLPADDEFAGELTRHTFQSTVLGTKRRVQFYTPPGVSPADELPLIYCHDGLGFRHHGRLPSCLDRLMAEGAISPVKVAFVLPDDREDEYPFNERYRDFTINELVAEVESRAGFVSNGERIAMGASLSGLFAAWLAWTAPQLFQHVVSFSGAFITDPSTRTEHRTGTEWLAAQIRSEPRRQLRYTLFCGRLEWLMDSNRSMAAALTQQGYDVDYFERNGGHNWTTWRDGMNDMLRAAFGTGE